jgi:peptidyl-tRNA hydrolase
MKRIKILARKNLKMSPGKLAAQSVHAALALGCQTALHPLMSVVVLEVNGKPFEDAKAAHSPIAIVRDAGFTEVEPGTETCIAFLEDDPRATEDPLSDEELLEIIEEIREERTRET